MTNALQIAVVGYGAMGKKHVYAWSQVQGVAVVGVVSRSVSAEPWQTFRDVPSLLATEKPDIVSVCTPTDTHPQLVRDLLMAGCDVVAEKPLALDETTARELMELATSLGRSLHVAHVVRYFPQYQMIAAAVAEGRIGTVATVRLRRAVESPTNRWFAESNRSGGVQFDLMIHDIDFALTLLGEPRSVYAIEISCEATAVVQAVIRFENGAVALIEGVWGSLGGLDTRVEVSGSLGNIETSAETNSGIRISTRDRVLKDSPLVVDPYVAQLRDIVRRRGQRPAAPDAQALLAIRVCAAISESLLSKRAVSITMKGESL